MIKRAFSYLFWVAVIILAIYQASSSPTVMKFAKRFFSYFSPQKSTSSRLKARPSRPAPKRPIDPVKAVTLYLKNGSIVHGELLRQDERGARLLLEDVEVEFTKKEIDRIEKGRGY